MFDTELEKGQPSGVGGWLVLVGIGLVLTPIRLSAFILQTFPPIFCDGAWEILTTPGSDAYHSLWAPVLIFEILANVGFVGAYLHLLVFFFLGSRLFPKAFITVTLINLGFVLFDAWFGSIPLAEAAVFDADTIREFSRSLVAAAIWVPYMMVSKRVKNTFVE